MSREPDRTGTTAVPAGKPGIFGQAGLWGIAQAVALTATVALVAGLFLAPEITLSLLWNVTIPLLPALFLVNAALWRNICPLGTLNTLANGRFARLTLPDRMLPAAGAIGILLLALMVPARRFLFNENGPALALTIVAVAVLALLLGAFFDRRAGFCNSICPVLPVERLYGQSPLVPAGNARCGACSACVPRGCLDVSASRSIQQTLGASRQPHGWLHSGYGIFAAAFPGFVLGYYLVPNGPLDSAGTVYATVAGWSFASYVLTQLLVRGLNLRSLMALRLLAALAIGLYYWFVAPVVVGHLGLYGWASLVIRSLAITLIVLWLVRMDWPAPNTQAPVWFGHGQ